MWPDAAGFILRLLRPPLAALLCLCSLQLATIVLSSCHPEQLPQGAVRVRVSP